MTFCPFCGQSGIGNWKYCQKCGNLLIDYCHKCGSKVYAGMKFCNKCGTDIRDLFHEHANETNTDHSNDEQPHTTPERFEGKYLSCQRCGGPVVVQTVSESRDDGCMMMLLYILLAVTILGLLIVIPLALRKKTELHTYATCQRCGYRYQIN